MVFARFALFTWLFTGSCVAERGSSCWDLPIEWGEDVGGILRDSDACYVEECWGLLGCFEGASRLEQAQ